MQHLHSSHAFPGWPFAMVPTLVLLLHLVFGFPGKAAELSDLSYRTINGDLIITDCDREATGELTIPASIEGTPVVAIGSNALRECRLLTKVIVSEGITSIHNHAFRNCQGLKSISIPDSVEVIGDYAFYFCLGLEELVLPNYLTSVGYHVFNGCASLTTLRIPAGVTSVQSTAFKNCGRLREIQFLGDAPGGLSDSIFSELPANATAIVYDTASGYGNTVGVLPITSIPAPPIRPNRWVNGRFVIEINPETIDLFTLQYSKDLETWNTVDDSRIFLSSLIVPLGSPALTGESGQFRFIVTDTP